MLRSVIKWVVIVSVVIIIFDIIISDPTGAGHTVGGWITGFFHALGAIGVFLKSIH